MDLPVKLDQSYSFQNNYCTVEFPESDNLSGLDEILSAVNMSPPTKAKKLNFKNS